MVIHSGVTENIWSPCKVRFWAVLGVSQALSPLESLCPRNADVVRVCRTTWTTPFFNWMMRHHTGRRRLTCDITSMDIFLRDRLDKSRTTTCHLPNGYTEVLTPHFVISVSSVGLREG
ncbi:hypothetical protein TNCV_4292691 [Trichonephila clavipes]|uniref:Uncharacterized protein n=1 Tax=Trichonephila clavipes TaxID=2585209 RepID=A0A8X6RKT8_TRICX|nr:hypothetical protein TNCV_4292691 [Trichonephila clavipes]